MYIWYYLQVKMKNSVVKDCMYYFNGRFDTVLAPHYVIIYGDKMAKIWNSKAFKLKTGFLLFESIVLPTATNESGEWPSTEAISK